MVDEWYGVHVGKKIESIGDVEISDFFQHHTLILLIGRFCSSVRCKSV